MTKLIELDALIASLDSIVQDVLDEAAEMAVEMARAKAPVGKAGSGSALTNVPGALAKSIEASVTGRYSREVGTPRFYARWVENGRNAFQMKGKILRFYINGQIVFRRSVGPARAQPFIGPVKGPIQAWLTDRLNAAIGLKTG